LIVSVVKICKQCLQTASASGGRRTPDPLTGSSPLDPLRDSMIYSAQRKLCGASL